MTISRPQTTALYANQSLNQLRMSSMQASERISTGLKINSAKDDPAGIAEAARLSSKIVALQRAASNASDGIQMLETASSAAGQIGDALMRMRELALQSLNDTYSPDQRQSLDIEFQQLKAQMLHVANHTQWNDQHLLNTHLDVGFQAEAAAIRSNTPINTLGPASGNYTFYLNGVGVEVALEQGESQTSRLQKLVAAVQTSQNLHGVVASISPEGGLALLTPDGRDLSAWYDSASTGGLNASHLGLGQTASKQMTAIALGAATPPTGLPTKTVTDHFVEFNGLGESSESILPVRSSSPSVSDGMISVVDNKVYRGNGSQAAVIGTVDAVKNGLNGQPLRIQLKTDFTNGNFEAGAAGDTSVAGWQVVNQPVRMGGASMIAGFPTPADATPTGAEPAFVNQNAKFSTSLISSGLPAGSSLGLNMVSTNISTPSYGVVHGPYVVSEQPVPLDAGSSVSFDWKAQGGADSYDVYAYLLNTDTGQTINLLNRTGTTSNWTTSTTTVPQAGNYKFVFISGTYDQTGGTIAGAQLSIDNVRVNGSAEAYEPSTQDIDALTALVTYSNPKPVSASLEVKGVLIESVVSEDLSEITDSLQAQLQQKIDQGEITDLRLEREGDELRLVSTVAGAAFAVKALTQSSASLSLHISEVAPNTTEENLIDGIAGATAQTTGARVVKGSPLTEQILNSSADKFLQIGDYSSDFIRVNLPNFGATGHILRSLVWDVALQDPKFTNGPLAGMLNDVAQYTAVNLLTSQAANQAMGAIDQAMSLTIKAQTALGATVSRLDHVLTNLAYKGTDASSARSQIQDSDYAKEASHLSRAQLMEQVAMQVLTQSQTSQRSILQLLA
jgi:flagellin-like hook-associated protein FlgL